MGVRCARQGSGGGLDRRGRGGVRGGVRGRGRLGDEIFLIGQGNRIDLWNRADLERSMGIDWDGDDWPDWSGFIRRRPLGGKGSEEPA